MIKILQLNTLLDSGRYYPKRVIKLALRAYFKHNSELPIVTGSSEGADNNGMIGMIYKNGISIKDDYLVIEKLHLYGEDNKKTESAKEFAKIIKTGIFDMVPIGTGTTSEDGRITSYTFTHILLYQGEYGTTSEE